MIADTIQNQIKEALKTNAQIRLSTLRMLSTELHNAEIAKIGTLTKEEELVVVRKEVKKRKDAIEAYEAGGRPEKAEIERQEMVILQEFLPKELAHEELEKVVEEAINESGAKEIADMGKVIGLVMKKTQGRAEGGTVSALVRSKLNS